MTSAATDFVPPLQKAEGAAGKLYGVDGQFVLVDFDFALFKDRSGAPNAEVVRARASA